MATSAAATKAVKKFRLESIKLPLSRIKASSPQAARPTVHQQPITSRNPFLPQKTSKGRWAEPKLSLRRQADLVKKAKAVGLLHLLPPGPKNPSPLPFPPHGVSDSVTSLLQKGDVFQTSEASASGEIISEVAQTAESISAAESTSSTLLHSQKGENLAPRLPMWHHPIIWTGDFKPKVVPGAELGTRLYANKKRMFKGHRWERMKSEVERKRSIVLRDMKKRLAGYKSYYKKRKPNPLKPSRSAKAAKLPF